MALKRLIEESVAHRHYLRLFGASFTKPTAIYADNLSVLRHTINPGSTLQNKHIALAHHFCREHHSENVVDIRKTYTTSKLSNALTKSLGSKSHHDYFIPLMSN